MRMLIGVAVGVAISGSVAYWWGAFRDPPPVAAPPSASHVDLPQPAAALPAETKRSSDGTAKVRSPLDPVSAERSAEDRAAASRPTLPFGCYANLDDMPPLLRQEAIDIVGEEAAAAFPILYFGEYELRTVQTLRTSDAPEPIPSTLVLESMGDWISALDAKETLLRRYIEDADFRNEGVRFETLEAARTFAEQSEDRVTRRSIVSDGFVVVDVKDLRTRADFREAEASLEECRAVIRQQGLMVSSYGYDR